MLILLSVFLSVAGLAAGQTVDFGRDIRPILSDNCFQCHGPDEKHRMAGLRLDIRENAFAATKQGPLIVPGDPGKSVLFQRLDHAQPARRMPPPASGRSLKPEQIQAVRRWIEEGAKWQTHWAFTPPQRPEPPVVSESSAIRNPIDRFIQARLEKDGLNPAREAGRRTLLRRLSFDLTGLPPTPQEIVAFVADKSPDAYEKQVDRLLQSPHYGERMAMEWLDVARYADTHGYHIDSHRDMWPWRDWVIKAFNTNMPFDKFTTMQLAGDLMPEAGIEGKIASGFNRNHMINFEGGAIPEEYLAEYVADRVETTSTAWLGLTMGCARCHTHKYDPISHKEYYQFFAFFNNVAEKGLDGKRGNAEPFLKLPTADQRARQTEIADRMCNLNAALGERSVIEAREKWQAALASKPVSINHDALAAHYEFDGSLTDISGNYRHGRTLAGDPDFGSGQVAGAARFDGQTLVTLGPVAEFEANQPFTIALWFQYGGSKQSMPVLQKIANGGSRQGWEIWLEDPVLVDIQKRAATLAVRLTAQWPAQALVLRSKEPITQREWNHVAVVSDGSGTASGLKVYLNGAPMEMEVAQDALKGSIRNTADVRIGAKEPDAKAFSGGLDDLRFYARALPGDEVEYVGIHYPIQAVLSGVSGKLKKDETERIEDYYLRYAAPKEVQKDYKELLALREEESRLDGQILTTMVMEELEKPRDTFILARGDYRNTTEKVQPGTPAALPPLPAVKGRPNRLTLARWLVDPAHPLTARVAVNRYWQMYFGTGLVKTSENFGSQGESPSHPELLDWLATEFVGSGWDIKAMQRLIVTSAAYRRASHTTPELREKDPENRLLARGPRFRLPAEMIRDNALAVSGLLNREIGGASVFPYQPPGVWEEMAFGDGFSMQAYVQSHGADLYRRSMYTSWKRTAPPPQLTTFDAPDREKCTARRTTTNTPLQALVLMNDPTYIESARALAQKVLQETKRAPSRRAARTFELATSRKAGKQELATLVSLAREQTKHFRQAPEEAAALLTNGESPADASLNPVDLAAWTVVASTILNIDETISKE